MPGMADMHTHVDRKEMLPLFLAAGVTTVLNMGLAIAGIRYGHSRRDTQGLGCGPRVVFAAFHDGRPG